MRERGEAEGPGFARWHQEPFTRSNHPVRRFLVLLIFACAHAFAQSPTRLSSLAIEIWPEFDRPAALVILRGAIAEGIKLPAAIELRLPASSAGPAAVAYSATAEGNLLNLPYDQASAGEYVNVKFAAPERFFHVEFYEPIATGDPARVVRYTWPGDIAVERATLVVQEPASAQGIATEPNLTETSSGAAGLNYRAGDLGPLAAGNPVPITIRYSKADARPSVDIKGLRTAQTAPSQPAAPSTVASVPAWLIPMAGFALLAIGAVLVVLYVWRRQTAAPRSAAAFCTKCGVPLAPGSNYCGKCGTKVSAA